MSVVSTIHDVILSPLREIADPRGPVLHMMRNDDPQFVQFGECYFSEVAPGAVKAWKRHRKQTQNLAVPVGNIRIVIYDDRSGSPSCNSLMKLDIGRPEGYMRIKIPPGVWYGFQNTGTGVALIVNCADIPHDKEESEVVSIENATVPYSWD